MHRRSNATKSLGQRTNFFDRVYEVVRAVPAGTVMTYGEVARALGSTRGARAVGWALRALRGREADRTPWHRVVGAGGRISPRAGAGPLLQRRRLQAEGVRFRNGRVVLARHRHTRGRRSRSRAR
jgi:methylated-DNA-protein-cysteine methyltransferase-like protein